MTRGFVHSVEMGSLVDGPGVRFVVFLAGCPLRCLYCHNPDTWGCTGGSTDSVDVLAQVERMAEFLRSSGGGVTVSGGEPLAQAEFALEILKGSKALGLHTALDTSGILSDRMTDELLENVDLVLLDIKSWDPETFRRVTGGGSVEPTIDVARQLSEMCKPTWIRFVLVPGLTDGPDNVQGLAEFARTLKNVSRVEVVPFHQMGQHKWEQLGLSYQLGDTKAPSADEVQRVRDLFEQAGLPVDDGAFPPCGPHQKEVGSDDSEDYRPSAQ